MSARLAVVIYRWRRWLSAFIVIGAVLLLPRVNVTAIDNDLTAWFERGDPVYDQYEAFRDEFGGTRTVIVAIEAPSRDQLLSREGFEYIDSVTAGIERVEAVERVVSLTSATLVDARPADTPDEAPWLDVRPLFDDLADLSPAAVGERALDDDLLRGDLISADGTVAAVIVFFDESRVDDVRTEVLTAIKQVVESTRPADFAVYYNGSLEITDTYNRVTLDNQNKLTPPILALVILALYAMFRSWRRTFLTVAAVLVSLVWTLGLYSLVGFSYNVLSSIIVPLTLVLAIADDVHIIQHYVEYRRSGSAEEAFKKTVAHLFAPILGATATTALGLASLAMSDVVAAREFGLGAAIGVCVDFVVSIVLMPTMLGWLKPDADLPPQEKWFKNPLQGIASFTVRRAWLVGGVAAAIAVWAGIGVSRVRVETNHIAFFAESHPLAESARVIDSKLGGIYAFQILLEGPPESLKEPDVLRRMGRLDRRLAELPHVRKVTGLHDYVERIHQELGDGSGEAGIPDDPTVVAQELFVFALADEGRAELEQVVTSDFSKAQITIKQAAMTSELLYEQIGLASRMAEAAFEGSGVRATVTGSGRLFATLDHYLVRSQISSFTTAFLTVFAVIFLIFRSWRFGLLAIVPNLFPVLVVFGVMGWFEISLNVATVMLASVALGIVDDDTVHFISRYRRETGNGLSAAEAIEAATAHEGRAALTAALINSCAFAMLAFSEYRPTAWFGGLLALTMVVAFLAEVFILPATITLLPRLFGPDRVHAARRARLGSPA